MIIGECDKCCCCWFSIFFLSHLFEELFSQFFIFFNLPFFKLFKVFILQLSFTFKHRKKSCLLSFQYPLSKHLYFFVILLIYLLKFLIRELIFMEVKWLSFVKFLNFKGSIYLFWFIFTF